MFKIAHAGRVLKTKSMKNAELHVDVEMGVECSQPEKRQQWTGFVKKDSLLKRRSVIRVGCMVLRVDAAGFCGKEVFLQVKPCHFKGSKLWSLKPRIILDNDTYEQIKLHPPGIPQQTGLEECQVAKDPSKDSGFSQEEMVEPEATCTQKEESVADSNEEMSAVHQGSLKVTPELLATKDDICYHPDSRKNEETSDLQGEQLHDLDTNNEKSRIQSFVKEKIAYFEKLLF